MNREFDRFGTEKYAREELVAEIAAAYLCAAHNIEPTVRPCRLHRQLVEVLRNDSKAIFQASLPWLLRLRIGYSTGCEA